MVLCVRNTFLEEVHDQEEHPRRRASSDFFGTSLASTQRKISTYCAEEDSEDRSTQVSQEELATEEVATEDEFETIAYPSAASMQPPAFRLPIPVVQLPYSVVQVVHVVQPQQVPMAEPTKTNQDGRTTLMMRNLPSSLTRAMLLRLMDEKGFSGHYDFLYEPIDFVKRVALGYSFVNFTTPEAAARFWKAFERFRAWPVPSSKVCRLSWDVPQQGLEKHIERYRNSPLMHPNLPDEIRPVVFEKGARISFPPPTKPLQTPRLKASHRSAAFWKRSDTEACERTGSQAACTILDPSSKHLPGQLKSNATATAGSVDDYAVDKQKVMPPTRSDGVPVLLGRLRRS